jgi:hypothetical protein
MLGILMFPPYSNAPLVCIFTANCLSFKCTYERRNTWGTVQLSAHKHITHSSSQAAMAGPIGIIMAIGVSAVFGWFLILGLLFSIQDLDGTINSPTTQPVTQIFLDTVGEKGAIVLMVSTFIILCGNLLLTKTGKTIVIGAMYFCGYVTNIRICDTYSHSVLPVAERSL